MIESIARPPSRIAACLFVRNEERDIAEWIIYHHTIGFESFVIYDNMSEDRTKIVIDRLRRFYDIKLIEWPSQRKYSQLEAYDDCIKNFQSSFDWIAFIDADEFVAPVRDGKISAFLEHHPNASAVALNWSLFGSSGHVSIPSGLTISAFTKRASDTFGVNMHTKMIIRPEYAIRVCDPHFISVEGHSVKADGSVFSRPALGISSSLAGFDVCRVNHYFVKSKAQWELKMKRGYREGVRPWDHFVSHDVNEVEDFWAAGHANAISQALQAIDIFPLRSRTPPGHIALSEAEKMSEAWLAVPSDLDDLMFRAPEYSRELNNTLFDPSFYLNIYDDVRASGLDAFEHFRTSGYSEGRRPCSAADLRRFLIMRSSG